MPDSTYAVMAGMAEEISTSHGRLKAHIRVHARVQPVSQFNLLQTGFSQSPFLAISLAGSSWSGANPPP